MSVATSKTDGVTVFTLTSDPDSPWPPLCQILGRMCYNPVGCSVSQKLKTTQRTSLTVLGAIQIMIGLINIGLGIIIRLAFFSPWYLDSYYPVWTGSLFIVFGIVCLLSEKYPTPCLIVLNVMFSIAGAAMAIVAIVLYSIYEGELNAWYSCRENVNGFHFRYSKYCRWNVDLFKILINLTRGMFGILMALSIVEICVAISSAVLEIKALKCSREKQEKASGDPELYKPLLEEVTNSPAA